ncbi:MAG TPA: hypothetical protein DD637_00035 [Verrucomicrobia bacterium]|nr:hypothetical protein [Verrucomicrobiota bacterium]
MFAPQGSWTGVAMPMAIGVHPTVSDSLSSWAKRGAADASASAAKPYLTVFFIFCISFSDLDFLIFYNFSG